MLLCIISTVELLLADAAFNFAFFVRLPHRHHHHYHSYLWISCFLNGFSSGTDNNNIALHSLFALQMEFDNGGLNSWTTNAFDASYVYTHTLIYTVVG